MDPVTVLGIVNAAANLGLRCVSIVHALHTAAERFKTAQLAIVSLVEECSTIELAWDQLRVYVQTELANVPENEQIVDRIQRSLHAGELVIAALQKDLDEALASPLKSGLLQRTKVVWKEDILKDHQSRIRGQVGALTLLRRNTTRRPRPTERERLLTVKARVFDDSDASAYSIVPSICDTASISSRGTSTTTATETGDDIRYIPLDFEDSLFTSWVYKRNFRRPAAAAAAAADQPPASTTARRFPLGRRSLRSSPRSSSQSADDGASMAAASSSDGSSAVFSSTTSAESSVSQGAGSVWRPSLVSPITPVTPVRSSNRASFSSTSTSPEPEGADKLTKLFEVMGLPKDEAARRKREMTRGA